MKIDFNLDLVMLSDSERLKFILLSTGFIELMHGNKIPSNIALNNTEKGIIEPSEFSRYNFFWIFSKIMKPKARDIRMAGIVKLKHLNKLIPIITYFLVSPSILDMPTSNYSRSTLTLTRLCTTKIAIDVNTIMTILNIKLSNRRPILYNLSSVNIGIEDLKT
jgi:hypothetical protein